MTATVLLVHGAWHGSWCWDAVVAGLDARGIAAVAVDLPSRAGTGTIAEDAAFTRAVIERIDGPVVLCGHSYGGCVITEAAGGAGNVDRLVYLAALMLDEGETVMQSIDIDVPPGSTDLEAAIVSDADGAIRLDPELAAAALFADVDDATARAAIARLTPQPLATLMGTVGSAAWRAIPSTYVVCTADRAVPVVLQRAFADRATSAVEWATSHSPFLSRPELVVDLLAELAQPAPAS